MATERIFCGVCGYATDAALFEHLREAHGMSAEDYRRQCPNAPLFTSAFKTYVERQGIHLDDGASLDADGEVRMTKDLFGVKVSCSLRSGAGVPVVDEQYHFETEQTRGVLQSLVDNDRILLVGPTGAGKSSLIAQLAARVNWAVTKVNLHGETSVADFLGTHKVKDGEVIFQYGVLPTAMREGNILVCEELDAADPGILFVLQGVLEEDGTLTIPESGGEVVRPHPRFRLVATANTLGTGDESGGLYAGTQILNAAFLDRWTTVFRMDYLPEAEEAKLVSAKAPLLEHSLVDGMVKLAGAVRAAIEKEELYATFSTRRLLAFARKVGPLGLVRALEVCVLNKLPKTDRSIVAELAQRHLPGLESLSS